MPDTIESYLSLLPSANDDKPDFLALLRAFLQPFVDEQGTLGGVVGKYDLDAAVGAQLDVVGQWVGLARRVESPIEGVYFSFDLPNIGFDQGLWWTPADPLTELITLDDTTYRLLLRAKIASNYWDGSLAQLALIFRQFFAVSEGTVVFVIDNFDMTMTIAIAGVIPGAIFQRLFLRTHVPFPPAAVGSNVIITSEDGAPLFGFDIENEYIGGFDSGAWAVPVE